MVSEQVLGGSVTCRRVHAVFAAEVRLYGLWWQYLFSSHPRSQVVFAMQRDGSPAVGQLQLSLCPAHTIYLLPRACVEFF